MRTLRVPREAAAMVLHLEFRVPVSALSTG